MTAPALCSAKGRGALPLWLYRIQDWSLAASRLAFWHRSALLQPAYCRVIAGLLHFYDLDNFPVATAPALSSPHFFTLPDTCLMQGISWAIAFSRFGHFPVATAPALCNAKGRGALPLWLYQLEDWSLAASRLVFWHRSALLQPAYCRVIAGLCTFLRFGQFSCCDRARSLFSALLHLA